MKEFDLVIIGGGVAGLVSASGAAQLGARVALVDKTSLGGDCLRTGCVPTKRLVASAKVASLLRRAGEFGIKTGEVEVDFPAVMDSMRRTQDSIAVNDDPERFRRMGVEVFFGAGKFLDPYTFEAGDVRLKGRRFIIATGSSPLIPPVAGLKEIGPLTNETALGLKKLPASIVILGGGPIGVEFGQIFARLGSKVTIIEKHGQVLPREERELSALLKDYLAEDGVEVVFNAEVKDVKAEGGVKAVYTRSPVGERVFRAEEVMAAIGRRPNVEGLALDAAKVEFDARKGIKTDDTLRTSQPHIYAAGDCIGSFAFTHVAEYHAGIALGNALFPFFKRKLQLSAVPWTTFSDPELARVGLTEDEARETSSHIKVYRFPFASVDRAVIEGEAKGIIKVVADKKSRILGAHILGPGAGELLPEFTLAMRKSIPVTDISRTIHVYPTRSMALKRAADEYYKERLFTGWFPKASRFLIRRGRG
ncbi:MAG: mercuric reductase [Deltaproteobacteria bacterium]|nr:mercuric reductase [Deltaproteobacteria bacterium]